MQWGPFVLSFKSLSPQCLESKFYKVHNFCYTLISLQILRTLFTTFFNLLFNLLLCTIWVSLQHDYSSVFIIPLHSISVRENSNFPCGAHLGIFWPSVCLGQVSLSLCSFSYFILKGSTFLCLHSLSTLQFSENYQVSPT